MKSFEFFSLIQTSLGDEKQSSTSAETPVMTMLTRIVFMHRGVTCSESRQKLVFFTSTFPNEARFRVELNQWLAPVAPW